MCQGSCLYKSYTMSVASSTRESQRFDLLLVDIKRSFKRSQKLIVCRGWKSEQVLIRKEKKRTVVVYFCKFKVGWARFPPATPVITLSSAHQLSHPYLFHKIFYEYRLTNPISQCLNSFKKKHCHTHFVSHDMKVMHKPYQSLSYPFLFAKQFQTAQPPNTPFVQMQVCAPACCGYRQNNTFS